MSKHATSLVFLGMDSVYSTRVLAALYQRGYNIGAVIKPVGGTDTRKLDMFTRSGYFKSAATRTVRRLTKNEGFKFDRNETDPFFFAGAMGTPCYLVGNASSNRVQDVIERVAPDVMCIAFFNQLLKKRILRLPRLGTLNSHPSLLPAYRGPSPLFWVFKNGEKQTGVSIHLVDSGEDSGDILYREAVDIETGVAGPELLEKLADVAARLMVRAVDDVVAGTQQAMAQDASLASRFARPTETDLQVTFDIAAEEVFRMVRGLSQWAPLWCELGSDAMRIIDAESFAADEKLGADFVMLGESVAVQCQPGVVVLRVRKRR